MEHDPHKEAVEGFTFSLRQLRALRAEHQPDDVDDFFRLLEMWCNYQLAKAERQAREEAGKQLNGDD